ncbi:MAG TPA: hemerythrin domain-containing protein [Ideonella sp.]|uniref:hemerythrin domain-containing protein n=1 Tax=Ideonella sp. TaxID=1929293 RepID=UPI002E3467E3|nr:hemerythrin domain-containing protein [Ideonella sp.]HEX5686216.1 hemerythrin domain-containing protein [Ideonella sp.]
MPHSHPSSRAATAARSHIIELLQEDHWRLKRAYREFQRLDAERNGDLCESIVRRTLHELRVHAALEEELIYPVMRPIVSDPEAVDQAEVEHETIHQLISQLEAAHAVDEKFSARFVVLCEYVLHHVKEEEGELFPQLKRAKLDWETLCAEFTERREALLTADAIDSLPDPRDLVPTDETGLLMTGGQYPARYPPQEAGSITSRKI